MDFVAWIAGTGIAFLAIGWVLKRLMKPERADGIVPACMVCGGMLLWVAACIIGASAAFGRDLDGRFAQSPLKPWFDGLKSGRGPCCSDADGFAISDPDWSMQHGHYRVRISGEWYDVPDDAVITEPNLAGKAMVWPMYIYEGGEAKSFRGIRCFMPGAQI